MGQIIVRYRRNDRSCRKIIWWSYRWRSKNSWWIIAIECL